MKKKQIRAAYCRVSTGKAPADFFTKRNRLIAALSDELYAIDTGICDAEKKLDFKARLEYL